MSEPTGIAEIAIIGAGLIGERHARLVKSNSKTKISAIVDPSATAAELSTELNCKHFNTAEELLASDINPDGAIVATPNDTHRAVTELLLQNKIACLVEKPLAANSKDAAAIVAACENYNTPVLVGHHRRHHTISKTLRSSIEEGFLGTPTAAQVTWMLRKPDAYFAAGDWRTKLGGGPVWINIIHEVDLLRYFLGEIVEVSAMLSSSIRKNEAEESAVVSMRFENGAIGTAIVSDCSPSPWHFEGGSGENPNIAKTGYDGLRIFGTHRSISFPSLKHWSHQNENDGWGDPIFSNTIPRETSMDGEVALAAQLDNFSEVISGKEAPLVTAQDGLQSVRVVEAIHEAAVLKSNVIVHRR